MRRWAGAIAVCGLALGACAGGSADVEEAVDSTPELDGSLDCAGEMAEGRSYDRVDDTGDYDTAEEAVEKQLTWLLDRFPDDARIVHRGAAGSIVTDGREVAETRARQGSDDRWYTDELNFCIEE